MGFQVGHQRARPNITMLQATKEKTKEPIVKGSTKIYQI